MPNFASLICVIHIFTRSLRESREAFEEQLKRQSTELTALRERLGNLEAPWIVRVAQALRSIWGVACGAGEDREALYHAPLSLPLRSES